MAGIQSVAERARPTGDEILAGFASVASHTRIGRAVSLLEPYNGGALLDVGCGRGTLIWALRGRFAEMHGLDRSADELELLRRWAEAAGQPVQRHQVDLSSGKLPFESGSFDVVTCLVVLDFLKDPSPVIGECHRVLRPGGVLLASVGNASWWRARLRRARLSSSSGAPSPLYPYTRAGFGGSLKAAGYEILRSTCSGRGWQIKGVAPGLLAGDVLMLAKRA